MTYHSGEDNLSLWNDAIQRGDYSMQLPVRSLVGLIPLYATLTLEPSLVNRFPGFKKRMDWFLENRPEVSGRNMANMKGLHSAPFSHMSLINTVIQLVVAANASCLHSQVKNV
jgi:hypothetical protein